MSVQHRRSSSAPSLPAGQHESPDNCTAVLKAGVNPLYGSEIAGAVLPSEQAMEAQPAAAQGRREDEPKAQTNTAAEASGARRSDAPMVRRSSSSQRKRSGTRGGSPQSSLTTSTSQSPSSTSSRSVRPPLAPSPKVNAAAKGGNKSSSGSRSNSEGKGTQDTSPAPLVPALLAPVPPPPPKRKSRGDIETGGDGGEGSVLEQAPDKTIMEMLQSYLRKQDLSTRISLIVVLLVLSGGALGAYGVILYFAIEEQQTRYIVMVTLITLVLCWVLWKYCFSGDQKLQDQSQIAQDIATLYAAIPDHTAARGVSSKGRAQFTDFKYEKSEMLFTAVTDDGVSLGSERGSELMMDGADPACPLCNVAYVEGADLCLLPCLHVFHKSCINKWCNRNIVCPLCKRHLEAPEPLHTLTAAHHHHHPSMAHSEPGGHNNNAHHPRGTWRQMLGTNAPGPASGHGSERGLGGTRSEDGLWNDRVLNAAQIQMEGGRQNRVTSFSSETRRANSARGRAGERMAGGRGGPPQSSSAGASTIRGPQRAQSVSGAVGRQQQHQQQHHRIQRKRSSSFNTASERGRGSGRVAHGTAPNRGGGSGARGAESTSPRSRSDLGVGSRDADGVRAASDAMLSRHASRVNGGSGGAKMLTKKIFGEDGAGAWGSTADRRAAGEHSRKMAVVTVSSSQKSSQRGVRSGGQGPAVITVRKVKTAPKVAPSSAKNGRGTEAGSWRDTARSGGESESDFGGERVFTSSSGAYGYHNDDDSPEEVTTKALTYGPRKPRVSTDKSKSKDAGGGGGHRRQSSTGSTSAEESNSGKKTRRRPSLPGSRGGSGSHAGVAKAAATAEAVSKLLGRPQDDRSLAFSSRGGGGGGGIRGSATSVEAAVHSSDGESGSDGRADPGRNSRRGSARSNGGGGGGSRRNSSSQHAKTTPPKTGPVTKGTPAPPMAAARVATWNSSTSASVPALDNSFSMSMSETEGSHLGESGGRGGVGGGRAAASAMPSSDATTSPTANKRGSRRSWNIRIPSSAGSAEFFGFGSSGGGGGHGHGQAGSGASAEMVTEGEQSDTGGSAARGSSGSSLASRVPRFGASAARLFGSGAPSRNSGTAPPGSTGFALDSDDDLSTGKIVVRTSSSVQELIQTYEKARSSSDEKMPPEDWPIPVSSESKKRNIKSFSRRRGSGASASSMRDLAATESELEDEHIDRPKLSYKKRSSRHGRSRTSTDLGQAAGVGASASGAYSADDCGAQRMSTTPPPRVNPDGDDWGEEEPYDRPKLSYGGGLSSSTRKVFSSEPIHGVSTSSR